MGVEGGGIPMDRKCPFNRQTFGSLPTWQTHQIDGKVDGIQHVSLSLFSQTAAANPPSILISAVK